MILGLDRRISENFVYNLNMPRARNKQQLIEFGNSEFNKLNDLLATIAEQDLVNKPVFDNRTVKDIIAHLYAWHELFFNWYEVGMAGEKPEIPAPGYSFKDTPALNEDLYQKYKDISWQEILTSFNETHQRIMALIDSHSDEELTTKKQYAWTGSTNLASYLASATSSHYVWASQMIRKFKKTL